MLFQNERFGMFIHYGIYSVGKFHEQEQWRRGIPADEYVKYKDSFHPQPGCVDKWLSLAKKAGMEYVCFTTKHHDGFCMWDTAYTDYNIMNTPCGRDILKELADGCRKYDMRLALYYSLPDWHYPHYPNNGIHHRLPCPKPGDEPDMEKYKAYVKAQMGELLTKYGKIDALFWDIPAEPEEQDESINAYVRSLQPDILINDRGFSSGDYKTPERSVPSEPFTCFTEACQSVGMLAWGYRENEDYFSVRFLAESIDKIMTKGGNYLLNVGPDANGNLSPEAIETLEAIGKWYRTVSESYLGARFIHNPQIPYPMTCKNNSIYLHLPATPMASGLTMRPVDILPEKAVVLNTGDILETEVVYLPSFFKGNGAEYMDHTPYLHLRGIPVNTCTDGVIVLRMDFTDIDTVLAQLGIEKDFGKEIL